MSCMGQTDRQTDEQFVDSRLCPVRSSGLYGWAKFGCNLGCYRCRVLSPLILQLHITRATYGHSRHHPQNRKYITYRSAGSGWPSHGYRQHAQKFGEVRPCGFQVTCMRADTQTDIQTYSSQYFVTLQGWAKWQECDIADRITQFLITLSKRQGQFAYCVSF